MSRSSASQLAKERDLVHIGGAYYADSKGNVTHRSNDGVNLTPVKSDDIKKNVKTTASISTQHDPLMPNPLGEPSNAKSSKPDKPKTKKKKSLVEFTAQYYPTDKREKNYNVKYKIEATGSKQHTITIKALSSKDAAAKARAFISNVKLVGTPQLSR